MINRDLLFSSGWYLSASFYFLLPVLLGFQGLCRVVPLGMKNTFVFPEEVGIPFLTLGFGVPLQWGEVAGSESLVLCSQHCLSVARSCHQSHAELIQLLLPGSPRWVGGGNQVHGYAALFFLVSVATMNTDQLGWKFFSLLFAIC